MTTEHLVHILKKLMYCIIIKRIITHKYTYNDYASTIVTKINMVEKPHQNRLIFQDLQGPLTKFQYIQGVEFKLSNFGIFEDIQDVYEVI